MTSIRNIAIIAHVDHGKTTLVDNMLKQSGTFRANQAVAERAMDSNDLERERGITILAKCTALMWNDIRINIVDTPGHADFGGEVERILSMVDGVVLLVDASEGPMPQTKFVLSKALNLGLKPIVVINKIDRDDQRIKKVIDEVFELFVALEANNDQLDFPIVYASGRAGRASLNFDDKINPLDNLADDLAPLFDLIVKHVPKPAADDKAPFSMLVTTREYNSFFGRVLTGRVQSGTVKINQNVKVLNRENKVLETGRITKILAFRGLERIAIDEATAGDIIAVAGVENANVADTICSPEVTEAVPSLPIDPPTLSMTFSVNDSPLAGSEGTKVTSSLIGARLMRELESNVALKVTEAAEKNAFQVAGRGELQLGILIETMRREGFELSISRPEVLFQTDGKGNKQEPMEEIQVDVDDDYVGVVVKSLALRKAEMTDMRPSGGGKSRVTFIGPSRGLIGYHSQFLTETRGTGIMNRIFHGYADYKGAIEGRRNGVLISNGDGAAVAYALWNLEERGKMFINPSDKVYRGMIIGEHNRDNNLEVNPLKAKQLSNVRASGKDEAIRLTPPMLLTLEQAISYIQDDERVEVTPKSIRLRKALLDPNDRKRATK
ncbi:GTP-binding protein TypA/BipA [Rickettsia felis str. Pedreira]|uniref:Large ribosomal subunit assembly factor BipA n=2 Tax=Rickettsia felis TaxID=42862 RepID=A0A0F3MWS0_RICFI|nr:translational GTPase TypA [Rickettsia felis]AAY61869.1 GTP-binding protein TypA [Rickettsia felis URRWXCal2]KHO02570.1 GTP-binding protein TypA [Rickettsia felis str. LSU]KHO03140.1 GTP-binding protein TypA [Rickettsia felis]KJV59014.1 GTP-binding protein TypA/BipA [Rickettsia felis str. Pedreira]MDE8611252.1 translational GTPase TypA [Rickettsia felis]